jgi:glycosyltransferase involved in cell wall biosynthesis
MSPKIAYFIDSLDEGGAERLLVVLAAKVHEKGWNSEIYHFGNSYLERQCAKAGLRAYRLPRYSWFKSAGGLPLFAASFRALLRANKVDLLHSHLFGAVLGGALTTAFSSVRHLGTLHDLYSLEQKWIYPLLVKLGTLGGTRLVTVACVIEESLRERFSFSGAALQTIHNGVQVPAVCKREELRAKLGFAESEIILVSVGRLVPVKCYDILLAAFSTLEKAANVRLVLVGDGPERTRLEQLAEQLGIRKQLCLFGFCDDIYSILQASDCFVLASSSEGLSYSILEAMAAGLPIVCSDVGGNEELVQNGQNGFLVPAGDLEGFKKRLEQVSKDAALRCALGRCSIDRVKQGFSEEQMLEKYLAVYQEMLG